MRDVDNVIILNSLIDLLGLDKPVKEISTTLEISKPYVSQLLNAKVNAPDSFIERIIEKYNANIDDVLLHTDKYLQNLSNSSSPKFENNKKLADLFVSNKSHDQVKTFSTVMNVPKSQFLDYLLFKQILPYDLLDKLYTLFGIQSHPPQLHEPPPQYTTKPVEATPVPADEFMEAPYVPIEAQAGYLTGFKDDEFIDHLDTMLVPREYDKGNYLVVEVRGDSMDDNSKNSLVAGDKLLIKELPKDRWKHKLFLDYIFVIVATDGIVIKNIIAHDVGNQIITLHSLNPAYKDKDLSLEMDVLQLFYVKKLVSRNLNKIS